MSKELWGLDTDPFQRRLELLDDDHDPHLSGEANLIALPTPMRIRVLRGGVAGRETQAPAPRVAATEPEVDPGGRAA